MKVAAVTVAASLVAMSAPADACGVYDFGGMLAEVAKAFESKVTPVRTPLLEVGGGVTTDGSMPSIAVGYGWGEREEGFLFPGTTLSRVMLGVRSDGAERPSARRTAGTPTRSACSRSMSAQNRAATA